MLISLSLSLSVQIKSANAKEFDDINNLVVTLPTFKDFYQRFGNIKELIYKVCSRDEKQEEVEERGRS